ncbi:MAG: anti-sigma factor, partial [Bacteroidota bacterium]
KPHTAIKDMVAKKLIGIKDEIKAKIINERNTLVNTNTRLTLPPVTEIRLPKPPAVKPQPNTPTFQTHSTTTKTAFHFSEDEFTNTFADENIAKRKTTINKPAAKEPAAHQIADIKSVEVDEPIINTKIVTEEARTDIDNKSSSNILPIIGLIISLLLITVLGYYVFSSYQKLNDRLDSLQSELTAVNSQLANANNFVGNYSSLVEFFNYKDINVFSLTSAAANVKSSAKVLLSFGEKEGLIQFRSMPLLQAGQVFQLWMESKGQSYSLGTYQPVGSEYLKITSFPFLPKEQITGYKVTLEQNTSTATPSAPLLSSSLIGTPRRTR